VAGRVPGFGYTFLPIDNRPSESDLSTAENTIENRYYRLTVDPTTGALAELYDKELDHNFAGKYQGWGVGQYVYERVESDEGRQALFWGDFSAKDFGYGRTDTPWERSTVESVEVSEGRIAHGAASITVTVTGDGVRSARCTYRLQSGTKAVEIDWELDKIHELGIEAVFIAFPFNLGAPQFRADVNGVPFTPNVDQLNGTVMDWYPLGRWVDVSDSERGVTLTPLDAPLVHLGGITTGKWARELRPEGPTIMSWALHNHWMVNFKASQGGLIPLRYRLTTHAGDVDEAAATRFGLESTTPAFAMRDYLQTGPKTGQFLRVPEDAPITLTAKPAENGDGVIVRVQNVSSEAIAVPVTFEATAPSAAIATTILEEDGEQLSVDETTVTVPVPGMGIQSVRVRF
jgi:hypothetical protein